jgi:hypothetical protein
LNAEEPVNVTFRAPVPDPPEFFSVNTTVPDCE